MKKRKQKGIFSYLHLSGRQLGRLTCPLCTQPLAMKVDSPRHLIKRGKSNGEQRESFQKK